MPLDSSCKTAVACSPPRKWPGRGTRTATAAVPWGPLSRTPGFADLRWSVPCRPPGRRTASALWSLGCSVHRQRSGCSSGSSSARPSTHLCTSSKRQSAFKCHDECDQSLLPCRPLAPLMPIPYQIYAQDSARHLSQGNEPTVCLSSFTGKLCWLESERKMEPSGRMPVDGSYVGARDLGKGMGTSAHRQHGSRQRSWCRAHTAEHTAQRCGCGG